ncbi:LacI family DNA-binding transcriptional regulator [Microbacterium oryzae]|uniref:LacI family DNA-binding transcriptional regulator n=1 Tax=Microbacterium oryzae TaxID=743009 RepID=UPI0025B14E4C|nr:LacI family DNA-binding transcriptional regulator [Microbacterium oryzae]MDN3310462.1 LacI family DNA-binding transcriptional regulator [Microbacterium oryzae]
MADKQRATTLVDIAKEAGVSIATVSKALNGRPDVRAETRERVLDIARKRGFTPNAAARTLLGGRSGTVGLITSDLEGRFGIPVMMGAEDAFGAGEMSVFLCDARGDSIREQHHIDALLSRRVEGIIVVGANTNPRPPLARRPPVPVVYAYAPSEDPEDQSIIGDNVEAGRMGVRHLLDVGRARVAHISGDREYAAAADRAKGVQEELHAHGLELAGSEPLFGAWNEGWGRRAVRVLLDREPTIDGIVCGSDQIARGVIEGLTELGKRVPEDISVIGFDNWRVIAENTRPPLTSIDFRLQDLGRLAAEKLFSAMDGNPGKGTIAVAPRLVLRNTTVP